MGAERDSRGVLVPEPIAKLWIVIKQAEEHLQEIETAALERFSRPPTPSPHKRLRPWRRKPATVAEPSST